MDGAAGFDELVGEGIMAWLIVESTDGVPFVDSCKCMMLNGCFRLRQECLLWVKARMFALDLILLIGG